MENQPKPAFTLTDLEAKLDFAYLRIKNYTQFSRAGTVDEMGAGLVEALGAIHELIGVVARKKNDQEDIQVEVEPTKMDQIIARAVGNEAKPQFYVSGVMLYENKVLQGTSLYTTVVKAKTIRDICNRKFAELRVDHEAKIQNYPVF